MINKDLGLRRMPRSISQEEVIGLPEGKLKEIVSGNNLQAFKYALPLLDSIGFQLDRGTLIPQDEIRQSVDNAAHVASECGEYAEEFLRAVDRIYNEAIETGVKLRNPLSRWSFGLEGECSEIDFLEKNVRKAKREILLDPAQVLKQKRSGIGGKWVNNHYPLDDEGPWQSNAIKTMEDSGIDLSASLVFLR